MAKYPRVQRTEVIEQTRHGKSMVSTIKVITPIEALPGISNIHYETAVKIRNDWEDQAVFDSEAEALEYHQEMCKKHLTD